MNRYVASHLKDMNRKLVYDQFVAHGRLSRTDISRLTGISAPTVLKIVDLFLKHGLVEEDGERASALGRKPQVFRLGAQAAFAVGVSLEGAELVLGLVDLLGEPRALRRVAAAVPLAKLLEEQLPQELERLIREGDLPHRALILGAGIAVPGVVDARLGIIAYSPSLGVLAPADFSQALERLEQHFGFPVYLENDVNASVTGEYNTRKRAALGQEDMVYVLLGNGLGAGILLDGKVLRGRQHAAGEIGYMIMDFDFSARHEPKAWLESVLQAKALAQRYPCYASLSEGQLLEADRREFMAMADEIAAHLALCIVNMLAVVDVGLVVLGGKTVELLGEALLTAVQAHMVRYHLMPGPPQVAFGLATSPAVAGVAIIARELGMEVFFAD